MNDIKGLLNFNKITSLDIDDCRLIENYFEAIQVKIHTNNYKSIGSSVLFLFSYASLQNSQSCDEACLNQLGLIISSLKKELFIDYWQGGAGLLMAIYILVEDNIIDESIISDLIPLEEVIINYYSYSLAECSFLGSSLEYIGILLITIYHYKKLKNIVKTKVLFALIQLINKLDNLLFIEIEPTYKIMVFLEKCKKENICPAIIDKINIAISNRENEKQKFKLPNGAMDMRNLSNNVQGNEKLLIKEDQENLCALRMLSDIKKVFLSYHRYFLFT